MHEKQHADISNTAFDNVNDTEKKLNLDSDELGNLNDCFLS